MKKYWYEYEPFTPDELEDLIDRGEGLRDDSQNLSAEYKIACLELEIAAHKLILQGSGHSHKNT